ncbi:MAG: TPM domain-containing protein [Proteobacteria bacterium]|nr:TPM domain-containing protein [Pseudomonadota bacterium]
MARTTKSMFTEPEMQQIAQAVRDAELKTSGEIVPYFIERSDRYEEAVWRGAGLAALLVLIVFASLHFFTDLWIPIDSVELALLTIGAGGLGTVLVATIPLLKRFFAGQELIDHRVALRAADAFIAEEVFKTRDRTGILIFLSLEEHKVLVVGDRGINDKVDRSEWEDIVARIVRGINNGRPADGLVDAIAQCGALLGRHGFHRRSDDVNELANRLRVGQKKPRRRKR